MAVAKVLYAVRMPVDLKRQLDAAAASGGVNTSQLVIAACWRYLERGSSVGRESGTRPEDTGSIPVPVSTKVQLGPGFVGVNGEFIDSEVDQIMNGPPGASKPIGLIPNPEYPMCPYREYDEQSGETYACGLRVHPGKVKHTRGEVV